jgi:hypothetical protein|tara:strand:- start:3540 stop:3752 length:213 start_codon:yes stop_codon:yes gene_type:complete
MWRILMGKMKEVWQEQYDLLLEQAYEEGMTPAAAEVYAYEHIDEACQGYMDGLGDYLHEQAKDRRYEDTK